MSHSQGKFTKSDAKSVSFAEPTENAKGNMRSQKSRKFESLPSFQQAGVFCTKRLCNVQNQRFDQKVFVYDILKSEAGKAFAKEVSFTSLHR